MPSFKVHRRCSLRRTGKDFAELHKWMDEPHRILKMDHRRVRHDLSYIPEVIELFGKDAVFEFLMHISLDYYESAKRFAKSHNIKFKKRRFPY
jgi:hypothetical protein